MGDNDRDVMSRLRDVRERLQASLDEDHSSAESPAVELVEGQAEEEAAIAAAEADGGLYRPARRPVPDANISGRSGISAKRLAGIQRRIKRRAEESRRLPARAKALMVVTIFLASVPLAGATTLSLASCRFDVTNIGFRYDGEPGVVTMTLPVYNPTFVTAKLGVVELELYDVDTGESFGRVYTNVQKEIEPYERVVVGLSVALYEGQADAWLRKTIETLNINVGIRGFKYNGATIVKEAAIPQISLEETIGGALSSVLVGESDLFSNPEEDAQKQWVAEQISGGAGAEQILASPNAPWNQPNAAQSESEPPSVELFQLGIEETEEEFNVLADAGFYLAHPGPLDLGSAKIQNYDLGPIKVKNLSANVYVSPGNSSGDPADYTHEIASLQTVNPDEFNLTGYEWPAGKRRDTDYPVEIVLGGMSYAALRVSVKKDSLAGETHPSYDLDWGDDEAIEAFRGGEGENYPLWDFLTTLLRDASVDIRIGLEDLDINVFGIELEDLKLPDAVPLVFQEEELFDFEDLAGMASAPPVGLMGSMRVFMGAAMTGGLALPALMREMAPDPNCIIDEPTAGPNAAGVDMDTYTLDELEDAFGDMLLMDDFDLGTIEESWGPDANISAEIPLGLNNSILDLHLGLHNVSLGISSTIEVGGEDVEKNFAFARIEGPGGNPTAYLDGIGSTMWMNIDVAVMKDAEHAPYAANLLRGLLEDFEVNGRANLDIPALILFQENYTLPGLELGVDLGDILEMFGMGPKDLQEELGGMIKDLIEDLMEDLGSEEEDAQMKLNPLAAPAQLLATLAMGNPLMAPLTGLNLEDLSGDLQVTTEDGTPINAPKTAESVIDITASDDPSGTTIHLLWSDADLGEDLLPVTIGLGNAEVSITTKDQGGYWQPLMTLSVMDYLEVGWGENIVDIAADIKIHQSYLLCDFLDSVFTGEPVDIALQGTLDLNFSGVFMPQIQLDLQVPDVEFGLDLEALVDDLVSGMAAADQGLKLLDENPVGEVTPFEGEYDFMLPNNAQGLDIDQIVELGDFTIHEMEETGWPYVDQGSIVLEIGVGLTNKLFNLSITDFSGQLYDENETLLADVSIPNMVNNRLTLRKGIPTELRFRLEMIKGYETQHWFNQLFQTLEFAGLMSFTMGVEVFNCKVGPLNISKLPLDSLGLSVADLLDQINPLSPQAYKNGPRASQDVMDVLGNFGLVYLETSGGVDENVGSLNFTDPMFEAVAGLALNPAFNMSIVGSDLTLMDGIIYNAMLDEDGSNKGEALEYSKIAQVVFDPSPVYCNNTYAQGTVFGEPNNPDDLPSVPDESKHFLYEDPGKPYYDMREHAKLDKWGDPTDTMISGHEGADFLHYAQAYGDNYSDPLYEPYGLGTFAMTELKLQLFNISHGSYDTRYPKEYWRAMGGPYFPVQVFGPEHGGYPDHKHVYHPHYSPLANLLQLVGGDVSALMEDPAALLERVAFGGQITLNVFSMNITLDAGSDAVSELLGSLLLNTVKMFVGGVGDAVTPFKEYQSPEAATVQRTPNAFSDLLSGGDVPSVAEIYTDLEIDMESLIDDYPYLAVEDRNDHMYCPGLGTANQFKATGNNVAPWHANGTPVEGYVPGLQHDELNPGGSTWTNFTEDHGWERFKDVTEAWRLSVGYNQNPFWEVYDKNGSVMPKEVWAPRWSDSVGSRCPSWAGIYVQGIIPAFDLGLLAADATLWFEDPRRCGLAPMGYAFINSSIYPRPAEQYDDPTTPGYDESYPVDNGFVRDDYGNVEPWSNWAMLNIRLFHSPMTRRFFTEIAGEDFNIHFVADFVANASLFGYEVYDLTMGGMGMGSESDYVKKCDELTGGTEGGNLWGIPGPDGTVEPREPTPEWLPEDFLPQYDGSTYEIDLDGILSTFTDDVMGLAMDALGGLSVTLEGITIQIDLPIESPIPLPLWITELDLEVEVSDVTQLHHSEIQPWEWWGLAGVSVPVWVEENAYADSAVHGENSAETAYDLNLNTIKRGDINWPEEVVVPDVTVFVGWGDLIDLAYDLFASGDEHMWLTFQKLDLLLSFPTELGYQLRIKLTDFMPEEDLYVDLGTLI